MQLGGGGGGGGGGGANKNVQCTKKNCIPMPQGTIKSSVHNSISGPSCKRLQLYSWDMNGRYIGL